MTGYIFEDFYFDSYFFTEFVEDSTSSIDLDYPLYAEFSQTTYSAEFYQITYSAELDQ